MLPKEESRGEPHRNLTTFEVYEEELVLVAGVPPDGRQYEKLRVDESGRFAVVPLPDDIEGQIVDPGELEEDIDVSEMRIVGQMGFIEERDQATAEFRMDGAPIADSGARGQYGLLWVPIVPE